MNITPKSVEKDLQNLIDKYNLSEKLTLDKIKTLIYNEEGDRAYHDYIESCIYFFSNVSDTNEIDEILQVFVNAWNSFPHKSLGGKSPYQMVEEYKK